MSTKWFNLQKSASKFTPKKVYEIGPSLIFIQCFKQIIFYGPGTLLPTGVTPLQVSMLSNFFPLSLIRHNKLEELEQAGVNKSKLGEAE